MRRGFNGSIHRNDSGQLVAVDLGADYCAEHEHGTKGLRESFGLDEKQKPGIEQYRIRRLPRPGEKWKSIGFFYDAKKKQVGSGSDYVRDFKELIPHDPIGYRDGTQGPGEEIAGAWDEDDFLVTFRTHEDAADLAHAFETNDIAFLFGNTGGNPFARAGLVLAIISRMDPEHIKNIREAVLDRIALQKAADKTGIVKRLKKASEKAEAALQGKPRKSFTRPFSYYALSPSWATTIKSTKRGPVETTYPVIFWLNPTDQKENNSGWYTVEQLDAWTRGEGPIPKSE